MKEEKSEWRRRFGAKDRQLSRSRGMGNVHLHVLNQLRALEDCRYRSRAMAEVSPSLTIRKIEAHCLCFILSAKIECVECE